MKPNLFRAPNHTAVTHSVVRLLGQKKVLFFEQNPFREKDET